MVPSEPGNHPRAQVLVSWVDLETDLAEMFSSLEGCLPFGKEARDKMGLIVRSGPDRKNARRRELYWLARPERAKERERKAASRAFYDVEAIRRRRGQSA